MRHRLLYQIGLTDDPWQEQEEVVEDDEYSQDEEDPMDVAKKKRSKSFDKFTLVDQVPRKKIVELF